MRTLAILRPQKWAQKQFATTHLGDERRTTRATTTAACLMQNPAASLPQQLKSAKALKAAYRLLQEDAVTFAALLAPHTDQTRQASQREKLVLLVQDTTQVDYSHHPTTTELGPIGTGQQQGYLLQTTLAIVPEPRQVVGLAHQEPFLRQPAPAGEDCKTRRQRPRESQVWSRAVVAVGPPAEGSCWVQVGDRYSDIFEFMATCRQQRQHFLVRAAQNRRVRGADETQGYLFSLTRDLPAQGAQTLDLPARHGQPARQAQVAISFSPVTVLPPTGSPYKEPLPCWVVRVWEPAPPEGSEALEWVLITSLPTVDLAAGWERVAWYTCRWLVEDYHQCLKTGCGIEQRQLQSGPCLFRLLGLLSPVALRLLQLREVARLTPERLALAELPRELVQVVALLAEVPVEALTVQRFWREVARQGGYLGRRRDGPPGWKTLWKGWFYIQTLLEGIHLAQQLPP